ncbi:hypothetical protein K439DRAFT_1661017 [Ramaria rubella]|nr:hypothetical protein K439DRAFT_1661017 [Ramaria rubella]
MVGVFDNFGSLDALIQVIYNSTACFVLISNVEIASWVVELGLVGSGGRWWRGSWSEKDVLKFAGSKVSEEVVEAFASRLANLIIAGEVGVGGWGTEQGAELELQIDPTGKYPVAIDLVELPAADGSARAVTILKGIALQAQSRGCRIIGSTTDPVSPLAKPRTSKQKPDTSIPKQDKELQKAQEHIRRLESEVIQVKEAAEKSNASPSKPTARKAPPGASRANPTRQKRKIVEAEFESD